MDQGNSLPNYTSQELSEALRAIDSMISKCEKVHLKIKPGSSQDTLLKNRLKALYISQAFVSWALKG